MRCQRSTNVLVSRDLQSPNDGIGCTGLRLGFKALGGVGNRRAADEAIGRFYLDRGEICAGVVIGGDRGALPAAAGDRLVGYRKGPRGSPQRGSATWILIAGAVDLIPGDPVLQPGQEHENEPSRHRSAIGMPDSVGTP
jgi:hypothetical protein